MTRSEPQQVLSPLTDAAIFLVVTVRPGGENTTRELLAELSGLRRSVGFRQPDSALSCVVGVGSAGWDRLFSGPRPAELHPFREFVGAKHRAVATPGDLLFHIRAPELYPCFELARHILDRLAGAVVVQDEVHGFRYYDHRDLLGFVDGTENPEGDAARDAAVIGAEDPGFAGGSYVIVQKYLHNMREWDALPVESQEKVIGRTKMSNIELDDAVKPDNSHVALTTINDAAGTQRQIVRVNMPFGELGRGEQGTYFIGYSCTPTVLEQMLENMFIGLPPGNYDRILDFSTATTGTLFFVPAASFLDNLPDPPAIPARHDASLGIGDLKRSESR